MCKCILSSCVCKTKPQGLPSCLPEFKMCLRVRVDSCFRLVICLCLFCSEKGRVSFLGVGLAHLGKNVHLTPEPLLPSDRVSGHCLSRSDLGGNAGRDALCCLLWF